MIFSKTPVRITFFGGGSDYPSYYLRHGGETLGMAINKYSMISVGKLEKFSDYKIQLSYRDIEKVNTIDDLKHPSARECLRYVGIVDDLQIHYSGDLPARTGLGSSSSFTVGLLNALYTFKGQQLSKEELAKKAIYVEQNLIGERVGCQDQLTCSLGGIVNLHYEKSGLIYQEKLQISDQRIAELTGNLLLVYTGILRYANDILEEQMINISKGLIDSDLTELAELAIQGKKVLTSNKSLNSFGELLHEGWQKKKKLSTLISNASIDELYEIARKNGAIGGKLLGAGGGGFFLIYAEEKDHRRILNAIGVQQSIDFCPDMVGTRSFKLD